MFPVVKRQKKNPLRLRNGFSSKYGVCSFASNMLLAFGGKFPDKQGKYRENDHLSRFLSSFSPVFPIQLA